MFTSSLTFAVVFVINNANTEQNLIKQKFRITQTAFMVAILKLNKPEWLEQKDKTKKPK